MEKKQKELNGVKEIARRAKVSIATVDRVLHNRPGVSEKTKQKILEIIKELDYKPNILARRLASSKTMHLYTLIPEKSKETDYWDVPLQGIFQAENEIKLYNVKVSKFFYDMNDKQSFIEQTKNILKQTDIDGLLLAPAFVEEAVAFTEECKRRNIPFVFINSDIPQQKSLSYFGPNLFHSGQTAAHLIHYLTKETDQLLLLNIAKDIDSDHHILRKEEGFMSYFNDNKPRNIIKENLYDTNYPAVKKALAKIVKSNPDLHLIFVTNSRVALVAKFLQEIGKNDILLIGYDFLPNNIEYLNQGMIDFLICEKPQEQAYRGIKALYRFLMFEEDQEKEYFMPIDIIHRENQQFYKN
ncbi:MULTISPECIES: LacI family DNA-binding transcriptional regulator [Sphingobacterium]|uniref:LacI family DNA-binding transcriptional regulator n=1 Tax=Sphingobacterium hotanense TaxID=649196 RepID=A0ABT7NHY5_9SPHI|nr:MULTISPECIES: LacI family DNA-binding transcriptional regulator [Sphingobacterium]MCT1523004.1 LacI family DNA-binding transcriptional regulator [Sphingobacterium hotanense]MDM1046801.1 LacI family DNA-binding transcriptional regulator [Sphingobacterium hotanense]